MMIKIEDSRNSKLLISFVKYCNEHPSHRFWQALRNWSGIAFIFALNSDNMKDAKDTFYWENKNG
ncbi:MAG: hypothetical protein WC346_18390 [Methanogenium sp.]|jgi:hypothetical protein